MWSWKMAIALATLMVMIVPQLAFATVSPGTIEQKPSAGRTGDGGMQGDAVSGDRLFETTGPLRSFGSLFYYQILAFARWVSWLSGWTR